MANANQIKTSWDAFDKIFDEAFSRTKQTADRPPYFSPTPFTPYPPTDYGFESALAPYTGDLGRNPGHHEIEEQDFNAHTRDYHQDSDRDDSYGLHYDDVYSRADMEYYEDDDYEKEFWTKRARKAQAVGQGNSAAQRADALKLTGVAATGFSSGTIGTNAMGLNVGSSAASQRPQPSTSSQTVSQPRLTITTSVNPTIGNNNNAGAPSAGNPLANAMNAFSAAAATLNGISNTLNNLGLGLTANSTNNSAHSSSLAASSAAPRAAAPIVSQVPTIAQPRPPIRKPPPPLNLDDFSSGSGSASSSSLDPTSPFKLSPGPSPPAPSAPPATVQYQADFYPQHQGQFQFQQYQFQPDNQIPTSRSMFLQQQQQQHAQTQQKGHQSRALAGHKQGQEQGKPQEAALTQVRSQTQPIPVPTISKASTQAAIQESQSRSFERSTGVVPLVSPSPRSKVAALLSTSPNSDSVDHNNVKSPTPSTSTIHKKRRPNPGKVTFRNSSDGTRTTATFDMQGIKKSDVHVSYQNDKVVVSWESITVEDKIEDGKIVRERREKKFVRTLPLPEGTKFDQVKASMDGRHLNLTYPKFRS